MVRDMARQFAAERLAPFAAEWDRTASFPSEALAEMGRLGMLGMVIPEEWDGAGADYVSYALALEEIAGGDGAVSTIMSVHNSVGCMPILSFGTAEQKDRFLRPMARGEKLGAFCLTEPQAGSDAAAIRTRARRDGNHWVLDGTKQFITNGKNGHVAIVFAVTDPAAGKKGISAFIVPTDTPGYHVARVEHKLASAVPIRRRSCWKDAADARPDAWRRGQGLPHRAGQSRRRQDRHRRAGRRHGPQRFPAALAYAKERDSIGMPIIEHQAVAFRLADMATRIEAARHLVLHAASLRDAGIPCLKEAAMAKLFASEMAERVCSDAIQIHGGYGYLEDFPVERIYRDVRVCQIYEGTSDIQRLIISRKIAVED